MPLRFPGWSLLLLLWACQPPSPPIEKQVEATAETQPVRATTGLDAADDPAIFVHPQDPAGSLIIGTNKKAGLSVYNLEGKELFFTPAGDVNNVDLRSGILLPDSSRVTWVASSERRTNRILVHRLDPATGELTEISGKRLQTDLLEIYGLCMYRSPVTDSLYVFVNGKSGRIQQWTLHPDGADEVSGTMVREIQVASQPEGMVADDDLAFLYVGEEDSGVWRFAAEPDGSKQGQYLPMTGRDNPYIRFDVEGLALYLGPGNSGYLLVSSQGNNSYAVYERADSNRYLGSFTLRDAHIDSTEDTDGIDVTACALPPPFEKGLFVAQDGYNKDPEGRAQPQNFKLVPWSAIAAQFDPPLLETGQKCGAENLQ
jgi:3-phytase